MSVLSDSELRRLIRQGVLSFQPALYPWQVQPCSIDLRLLDEVTLRPGDFTLGATVEYVKIPPFLLGRLQGRSSIGRLGVQVENAGLVDPGFEGQLTLELVNFAAIQITLPRNSRVVQLTLETLSGEVDRPYGHPDLGSAYQGQTGVTPSRRKIDP